MNLTTDVSLKGPIWAETLEQLVGTVFKTYWDVYALCISIGMMYDMQIESDDMVPAGYDGEVRAVPRNVLGHAQNKALLEYMLQSAMVTTKHLPFTEDERLEIAFKSETNENKEEKKYDFNPLAFLTKFANYGVTKIKEVIDNTNDVETLEALMIFLNTTYESGVSAMESADNPEELLD